MKRKRCRREYIHHPKLNLRCDVLRVACDSGRGKSSGSDLLEGEDLAGGKGGRPL
jgi:hypothetical protein